MSINIQTKLLGRIEQALLALCNGFEVAESKTAGNVGTLMLQRGVFTEVSVSYAFQSDYATIAVSGPAVDRLELPDNPPQWRRSDRNGAISWHMLRYVDGERVADMIDVVRQAGREANSRRSRARRAS
jgi:hypothetical protein